MNLPSISFPYPKFSAVRLTGDWQVQSVSLNAEINPQEFPQDSIRVPECAHLQPTLYPSQPYWGDRLRDINRKSWVYRRAFKRPPGTYRRARLHFEGVDYFAQAWINDEFIGQHEGQFAPFSFDVSHVLHIENAILTVRVSAPWDASNPSGTYPTDHVIRGMVKGMYEHGEGVIPPWVNPIGIWRPVWLLLDQGVSIDHVRIQTALDGRIDLQFRVSNSTAEHWQGSLNILIEADNHDGCGCSIHRHLNLPPGMHIVDQVLHIPDVRLWWSWDQGAPNLYHLQARLLEHNASVISETNEYFGVRTVQLERSSQRFTYWINDRPVFVRGTSYMPSLYLSECTQESLAHDLALARAANLNLLRLHVHVAPPEMYGLCDRSGMLIWQDFELNWVHDCSTTFEQRARTLQHDMINLLGNHPAIISWACHNEPTMIFARRQNLEQHPDPALYADAQQQDCTRPVFLCSGQSEDDWRRSGDLHSYYGAIWSQHYTDVYRHHPRLSTEFGFETPAALDTLRFYPEVWERLQHLEGQIDSLWAYQAALIQYQVEHFRRLRADCCAGYIHFWLVDLVPQVGCGVLDACRVPKSGYDALQRASQPLQVMLEHDGRRPFALWVLNDLPCAYPGSIISWEVEHADGRILLAGETSFDIRANASQRVIAARWEIVPAECAHIRLQVRDAGGELRCENVYKQPFQPLRRPHGYPWKFDPYLGTKVFDRLDAPSLVDQSASPLFKRIPLGLRESLTERILRQQLPSSILSWIARVVDAVLK